MERLEQITSDDVRFVDPFNDLVGRPALQRLLEHTRSQVANVRFEVFDIAQSGDHTYLKWQMKGDVRLLGAWQVTGMSELKFDADGKIVEHLDYWDASTQFYAHLPIIGRLLKRLRSLASIS